MHVPTSSVSSPIQSYLDELHRELSSVEGGQVATYIPELAKADPTWFGICFATTDGRIYEAGDSRQPFTIQSISKPFTYGLALEDRGREAVLAKIGVEPTGDAFNSISLEPGSGRPLNPMINAGAIAATSLVAGHSIEDRLERLLAVFSNYAGHQVALEHPVYESESLTGHRNRAIGHMLRNFGILEDDPEPPLDLYFRQCSIAVDCRDLSVMAATLANGGVNPVTGERAVPRDLVESVLSIMTTCGMYDYAGEWLYAVGMPAKSGVSGGILAVLPDSSASGSSRRGSTRAATACAVCRCAAVSRRISACISCAWRGRRSRPSARSTRWQRSAPSGCARSASAESSIGPAAGRACMIYRVISPSPPWKRWCGGSSTTPTETISRFWTCAVSR